MEAYRRFIDNRNVKHMPSSLEPQLISAPIIIHTNKDAQSFRLNGHGSESKGAMDVMAAILNAAVKLSRLPHHSRHFCLIMPDGPSLVYAIYAKNRVTAKSLSSL